MSVSSTRPRYEHGDGATGDAAHVVVSAQVDDVRPTDPRLGEIKKRSFVLCVNNDAPYPSLHVNT